MTAAQAVAAWPRVLVEIRPESDHVTATLRINGTPYGCAAATVEAMRAGIIARCATLATTLSRPVALDVDESGQRYRVGVRPSGVVQPIEAGNTIADAARLEPVSAPCRQCRQLVTVTDATCRHCGLSEPLRVELADLPPQKSSSVLETVRQAAPRHEPLYRAAPGTAPRPAPAERAHATRPPLVVHIDGETITTTAPAVFGRNPDAIDGHSPVKLSSPGREVSRTHALVDVDDAGRLIVTDHDSANGTYVDDQRLAPHTPTIIAASARLQLGDVEVRIQSVTTRGAQPSTQS